MARKGLTAEEFKAAMEKRRSAYLDNPEMYGFFSDVYDYIIEGATGYAKKKKAAAEAAADISTMDLSDEAAAVRRLENLNQKYEKEKIGQRGMTERPSVAERGDQLGLTRLSSGDLSRPVENFEVVRRRQAAKSPSPSLMGDTSADTLDPEAARSGDVGAVTTAPAAPKKQTASATKAAPATKAARTDDKDAPPEDMEGTRQSISDVRPVSRPSDVDDLDESAASMERQMASLMSASEPGGPEDMPMAQTLQDRDREIAAREPLGESAGRLAIQDFMERNFGFRPTVTFDVEEQEPGGSGSMF